MATSLPTTEKTVTVRVIRPFLVGGGRKEAGTLYACSASFAAELVSGGKAQRASAAELEAPAEAPAEAPKAQRSQSHAKEK